MELLWAWRRQHEYSTLEREVNTGNYRAVCGRKYIFNSQFDLGCNLAGNHFGAAASSLLASVILNRTMIFMGIDDNVIRSCQNSIYFKPWILTRAKLEPLLEKAGCNVFESREKFFRDTHNFVPSNPTSKQDAGVTRFCGYARSPLAALTYDDIFNSGLELFVDNSFLSAEAKRRTEVLFSNPILGLARFEPYGLLVRSFVGFTNQTVALAKAALEGIHRGEHHAPHECLETLSLEESFVIGVHLRHKRVNDSQNARYDQVAKQGILRLKEQHDAGLATPSKCVILVASDRAESIKQINDFVESMKLTCTVRFVQRDMTAGITQQQKDEHYEETGPFAQAKISMADWYLLSHSDYFLGTADSTFSFLIADIVASRLLLQPTTTTNTNTAVQSVVNSTKSPFLWELPPPSLVLLEKWVSVPAPLPGMPPDPGVVVIEHLEYERQRRDNKCPLKPL